MSNTAVRHHITNSTTIKMKLHKSVREWLHPGAHVQTDGQLENIMPLTHGIESAWNKKPENTEVGEVSRVTCFSAMYKRGIVRMLYLGLETCTNKQLGPGPI